MLKVKNLKASIAGKEILKGINLEILPGQIHVIMGPNGSGKSTFAQVVAGHPSYRIESGELRFENKDIKKLTPDKRAKMGIFLGFQHPVEVPGVSVFNFLRRAKISGKNSKINPKTISAFRTELLEYASSLKLSDDILRRSLNEGFSGGEKKRNEIMQMMALSPKLVILDEIDSGLDVDGLRVVAESIKKFTKKNPKSSVVLITHYARILKYLKADFVHVMVDGVIAKSGKGSLAKTIEEKGYVGFGANK
ncbi:MAG TPA: Fe-S cluster assembly ATPase SufC [Candidatus Saccharimonadales bacterium]|nr:Fe-S cluster assembly ATPase SufC [Candidatus Saccharimonadales bacterium]